jgi:hypothetical protein
MFAEGIPARSFAKHTIDAYAHGDYVDRKPSADERIE